MERLILGLGNPGERYRDTRHNVGFLVVEELARRWSVRLDRRECNAFVGVEGQSTLLAQPQTYMNRSGWAARCLVETHGLDPAAVLVVYDEVALPLGKLRLRKSGSPGGHRGLESVIENLRTDQVPRLRLGIAPEEPPRGEDLVEFVLAPFPPGEREAVEAMIARAADACEAWVREGAEAAMAKFNG
ncbi:MAG: aminoacyl-tRNA hydrolase [Thermoanaerobaculia bacterium]